MSCWLSLLVISAVAASTTAARPIARAGSGWHVLSRPIDPRQQTAVPWGYRSYWLQPWRAYLDTPPASVLRDAVGINFNVPASLAPRVAALLGDSGFKRARIEIGWSSMSYEHPDRLADPGPIDAELAALRDNGIRPLILLNASQAPGPVKFFLAHLLRRAAAGARRVQVDARTARMLVPGLSGFVGPPGMKGGFIATSVSRGGWVSLSMPLPFAVPAGTYGAVLLRYPPFAPPFTRGERANPSFERTLRGWLAYVRAVTAEAKRVLGSQKFDVEVWNESFANTGILSLNNYYNPVPRSLQGTGSVSRQLLARTVEFLRDPANGVPTVGIGDGFADGDPSMAGSTEPAGLTAIDKHPYHANVKAFPQDALLPVYVQNGIRPVNALGQPEGANLFGVWLDSFVPRFRAFFPEYYLSALQTEFMERDLSPIPTRIGGVIHGRYSRPRGASRAPQIWITETNIDPAGAGPLTTADMWHLQAKAAMRTLSAFVNKGVTAIDFFAVAHLRFTMVDLTEPGGGETMTSIRRFTRAFAGPNVIATRRSLTLLQIADRGNWIQFSGDGTAAHPPLYNRDVVGVFPFQVNSNKFVIPVYVMTRDMATLYKPQAPTSDVTRYDLPAETYRLTIGGLNTRKLTATATDPLTGEAVPVQIVSTTAHTATFQIPLTDSPRLLVLRDA